MTILKLAVCGALRWWRRCKGPSGLGQFVQQICWMRWRLDKMWSGLQVSFSAWEVPNWDLGPHVQKGISFVYQVICYYFLADASMYNKKYRESFMLLNNYISSFSSGSGWQVWRWGHRERPDRPQDSLGPVWVQSGFSRPWGPYILKST